MRPFRDSSASSVISGPRTDVPTETPLIGPDGSTSIYIFFLVLEILLLDL